MGHVGYYDLHVHFDDYICALTNPTDGFKIQFSEQKLVPTINQLTMALFLLVCQCC